MKSIIAAGLILAASALPSVSATYHWFPSVSNPCDTTAPFPACPAPVQTTTYKCRYGSATGTIFPDQKCIDNRQGAKPATTTKTCPCTTPKEYNWEPVTNNCGGNKPTCPTTTVQKYYVCRDEDNKIVADHLCNGKPKPDKVYCPCKKPEWTPCPKPCPSVLPLCSEKKVKTEYHCQDGNGNDVNTSACDGDKPDDVLCPCRTPEYNWVPSVCPSSPKPTCPTNKVKSYTCKDEQGNTVADNKCTGPKPASSPCPCTSTFEYRPCHNNCPNNPQPECPTTLIKTEYKCYDQNGNVVADSKCSGTKPPTVLCPCKEKGGLEGDPVFMGFHGQVYQVHGIAGAVFNLITHLKVQVNSRFELFSTGRDQTAIDALKAANPALPETPIWTHSGTYLSEISVQTPEGGRLYVKAGAYENGISEAWASGINGNASLAEVGSVYYLSKDQKQFAKRVSPSAVEVVTEPVSFTLTNSDSFFNIEEASLKADIPIADISGLLGASASPSFKQWKSADVMSFLVHLPSDAFDWFHAHEESELFGNEFKESKFNLAA